jgi:hypothetical protein
MAEQKIGGSKASTSQPHDTGQNLIPGLAPVLTIDCSKILDIDHKD